MPDEQTSQTPANDGTEVIQTPESGTEGQTAAAAAPVTPPVDYESKFKASQAEAIRLYQENQKLNQILANSQAQMQAASTPPPEADGNYASIRDAILDGNTAELRKWEQRVIENAKREISQEQRLNGVKGSRIQSSLGVVQEAFKNPVLGHEAMERYKQIMYDPSYSFVQGDEIDVPTPNGPIKVNPHLMRMAVVESQAKLAGRLDAAKEKARAEGQTFIEPAGGGQQKVQASNKFDATKHLSEQERAYCDKTRKSYDEYWKYMDGKLQAARLKAGKPLSRQEARV